MARNAKQVFEVHGVEALEGVVSATARRGAVVLADRGKPRAVVVPLRNDASLDETMAILGDRSVLSRIARAEVDILEGRARTLDEVLVSTRRRR